MDEESLETRGAARKIRDDDYSDSENGHDDRMKAGNEEFMFENFGVLTYNLNWVGIYTTVCVKWDVRIECADV